jgi:hypothetical protein
MTEQRRPIRRPPRWLRIIAAVVTVVYCVLLIPDHELTDVLRTAVLAPFFLSFAISPHGLYDGRSAVWTRQHPVATGGIMFVFFSALCLSGLGAVLDWGLALAITLPLTAVVVVLGTYFSRRHQGAASSSGEDGNGPAPSALE